MTSKLAVITITTGGGGRVEIDADNLRDALRGLVEQVEYDEDHVDAADVEALEERISELEGGGGDLGRAADEIRYGNLDEALIYLARAFPALDGLPALVAKEIARRTVPQGSAAP